MTLLLEVVFGAAAAAPELRTPAAPAAPRSIAEELTEEQRIEEASGIEERWFEEELLQPARIMGVAVTMAAVTAIQIINIAGEPATMVVEFILAAPW